MKLTCPTCQARYTIGDEKVRGKLVKIRCRKCGGIVIASGLPLEEGGEVCVPQEAPRTGERNEQSVLFSLSALTPPRAPESIPGPTSDASGLIDIQMLSRAMATPQSQRRKPSDDIAHLGFGGIFAPAVVVDPEPIAQPAERRKGTTAAWLAGIAALLLALGLVLSLRVVKRTSVLPASAQPVAIAALSAQTVPMAMVSEAPPPVASAPLPTPTHEARATTSVTRAAPSASSPAHADNAVARCCPGESETACEMRRSVGAGCGQAAASTVETPAAFDVIAASRALNGVDLTSCSKGAGPKGPGHARVTFQPSGAVSEVVVDTPELGGTATATCVVQAYRRAKMPAFSGSAMTVGKRFVVAGE